MKGKKLYLNMKSDDITKNLSSIAFFFKLVGILDILLAILRIASYIFATVIVPEEANVPLNIIGLILAILLIFIGIQMLKMPNLMELSFFEKTQSSFSLLFGKLNGLLILYLSVSVANFFFTIISYTIQFINRF